MSLSPDELRKAMAQARKEQEAALEKRLAREQAEENEKLEELSPMLFKIFDRYMIDHAAEGDRLELSTGKVFDMILEQKPPGEYFPTDKHVNALLKSYAHKHGFAYSEKKSYPPTVIVHGASKSCAML